MKKTILLLCCTLAFAACNRPPESEKKSEHPPVDQQAKKTSPIKPECQPLNKTMESIQNTSKINDLNQAISLIKTCVPNAPNQYQIEWLQHSSKMYHRFLDTSTNTEKDYEAFTDYGYHLLAQQELSSKIKDDPQLFRKLSARDQYLIQHNGQAYIHLQYVGEGIYQYRRHPTFLAELFAPHLPADQREFIEKMALDNDDIFMSDSALTLSWSEIAERALFWEKYIQRYPNSYFLKDAQRLFEEYSYYLFVGTPNTPVSDDFAPKKWIDEDALKTIRQLSKIENSVLADKAKKFLSFIQTPISKRNAQFDIKKIDDDGHTKSQNIISFEQLIQHLELKTPWPEPDEIYIDCHTDAVCVAVSY